MSLIGKNNLNVVGITESRVNSSKFDVVWKNLSRKLPNWDVINNYS